MTETSSSAPFEVMISYSHQDESLKNELRKHLSLLRRQGVISEWHDRDISPGTGWSGEIASHLERAQIILLLVSPDFLASDYCFDIEMKRAIERHERGEARVIPIFLRPCDWTGAPFGKLQGLPTDAEPVTSPRWSSRDEAFSIIARGIRAAAQHLRANIVPISDEQGRVGDLFELLKQRLDSPSAPAAEDIFEEWRQRAPVSVPMTSKTGSWLRAYELARAVLQHTVSDGAGDPYTELCAGSLRGTGLTRVVPIPAVYDTGLTQILEFACEIHEIEEGGIFCHPVFEESGVTLNDEFLDGLQRAWRLAAPTPTGTGLGVLWSLRGAGGSEIEGNLSNCDLGNGAAFVAFWHIRQRLCLDQGVYVLADCKLDGGLRPVRRADEMIDAIYRYHSRQAQGLPATALVCPEPGTKLQSIIQHVEDWVDVRPVHTLANLMAARSVVTETALAYLRHLVDNLDRTPWIKDGQLVRLSEVYVPPYVWKDELRAQSSNSVGSFADFTQIGSNSTDLNTGSLPSGWIPGFRVERRQVRVLWEEEFARSAGTTPIFLVGSAGFGKTSLLTWTARQLARRGITELEGRHASFEEVHWPALADFDNWIRHAGSTRSSLVTALLLKTELPEEWPSRRRALCERLLVQRLGSDSLNTYLLLDGLDQIGEPQAGRTWARLNGLKSLAPKIVISTRESGLRTHSSILPFSHITLLRASPFSSVESTELAAKWLGPEKAAELDGHLRSHPSLAVVAESPLLLTLACFVALLSTTIDYPNTAASLYREIMRLLARGAWREHASLSLSNENIEAFLGDLRRLAWYLVCLDPARNRFERDTLIEAIRQSTGATVKEANRDLEGLVSLGFLEPSGHENGELHYHFRHATFREFLAAWHLALQVNRDGWEQAHVQWRTEQSGPRVSVHTLLDQTAFEPSWESVFIFTAGMLNDPLPLLVLLGDPRNDDRFRHRLSLFCRCYGTMAAEKEPRLFEAVEPIFDALYMYGRKAVHRRPEFWRRWLADVQSLLVLPVAGQKITRMLADMSREEHGGRRMHNFEHEVIDLLNQSARGFHWQLSTNALLEFCEELLGERHAITDAATCIVETAGKRGEVAYVSKLADHVVRSNGKPWRQIPIARALLQANDANTIDLAVNFLIQTAKDVSAENWIRSAATYALSDALGGHREEEVAAFLVETFLEPSHSLRYELASEILGVARKRRSEVILAFVLLILRIGKGDVNVTSRCLDLLKTWEDWEHIRIGIAGLWDVAKSDKADCYPRVKALALILTYGDPAERIPAVIALRELAEAPISDGRQQWLALEALLEAGEPYEGAVRDELVRLVSASTTAATWIVRGCDLAVHHGDYEVLDQFAAQLLSIASGKNPNSAKEPPGYSEREGVARLLKGTRHWLPIQNAALSTLRKGDRKKREADWYAVRAVAVGLGSSELIGLTEELLAVGTLRFRPWHLLLRELDNRGWRLQVCVNRRLKVLRRGQEKALPDSELPW